MCLLLFVVGMIKCTFQGLGGSKAAKRGSGGTFRAHYQNTKNLDKAKSNVCMYVYFIIAKMAK